MKGRKLGNSAYITTHDDIQDMAIRAQAHIRIAKQLEKTENFGTYTRVHNICAEIRYVCAFVETVAKKLALKDTLKKCVV